MVIISENIRTEFMKEKRLVMYMHAGGGNHGCEAIVNSTCHMIKEKPVLLSYYGGEDKKYSLRELCDKIGRASCRERV